MIWDELDAILFDMDGTLVHTEPIYHRAWAPEIERRRGPITLDDYMRQFTGVANRLICSDYLGLSGAEIDETIALVKERFWSLAMTDIPLAPGVIRFLEATAGMPRAVATNSERDSALRILELSGLIGHFDTVVALNDVPRGKPAPDVFLEAAQRLRVAPARCLVIEDSRPGLRAAQAAGMRCVAITADPTGYDDASLIVQGLDDPQLESLFQRLVRE